MPNPNADAIAERLAQYATDEFQECVDREEIRRFVHDLFWGERNYGKALTNRIVTTDEVAMVIADRFHTWMVVRLKRDRIGRTDTERLKQLEASLEVIISGGI